MQNTQPEPTAPATRDLDYVNAHATNKREYDLLMYWYGIHTLDRRAAGVEPVPYDDWYTKGGQRLLLDYYREQATGASDPAARDGNE